MEFLVTVKEDFTLLLVLYLFLCSLFPRAKNETEENPTYEAPPFLALRCKCCHFLNSTASTSGNLFWPLLPFLPKSSLFPNKKTSLHDLFSQDISFLLRNNVTCLIADLLLWFVLSAWCAQHAAAPFEEKLQSQKELQNFCAMKTLMDEDNSFRHDTHAI